MNKSDYVICYWCGMDIDPDYIYEYLSCTTYFDACLKADRLSADESVRKYHNLIEEEAKEFIHEIESVYGYDFVTIFDNILMQDYIQYEVWRVLPETSPQAIKELFVDDPEQFCLSFCVREA